MKKSIISLIITLAATTSAVLADSMPTINYEPIFESAPISQTYTPTAIAALSSTPAPAVDVQQSTDESADKLQNALLQVDSVQVDLRNSLVEYKNDYADIDSQYQLIKAQRKAKKDLVKATEKRIKDLDKSKETIRKSM